MTTCAVRRRPRCSGTPPSTTPKALRILGKRILEVIAPEVGEAHEAKVLEAEEREAEAAASLWAGR